MFLGLWCCHLGFRGWSWSRVGVGCLQCLGCGVLRGVSGVCRGCVVAVCEVVGFVGFW